ncbi:MAG: BatD family protein [Endomicrobium sp.]|uniref:BatD family protein n=1 Tax=Candidatus Endomicrobiellum cubanum TaxID=3242325 RepID=UPI0028390C10|nr:BatD family protein [Endomicrobium sp.]
MFKKIYFLVFFSFLSIIVYADSISYKATVNRKEVPLNESFVYSITLSGDGVNLPEHQISNLTDFTKFGTATSQSMSVINGKTNVSITYKYTLGPKRIGKFTIPPAKITYNSKTYLTEALDIEVIPSKSAQSLPYSNSNDVSRQRGNQNQSNPQGKAFVKASVNKRRVYENEKLIYKFSFYTNVDLISNPEYFSPNFAGFWNDGSKPKTHFEIVEGINYRVDEIETVLYPIELGLKTIQPAKIKIAIMDFSTPDDMDDFFSLFSSMGRGQTKILETKPINIEVAPLPKTGKPVDFSGAIGDFKISASLDKKQAQTNDPVTLIVTVKGNGNMKSVSSINVGSYEGFKKYETIVSNNSENLKEFKTIFIPLVAGVQEIPSVGISFFNPVKKKYETIKTPAQKIEITGETVISGDIEDIKSTGNAVRQDINYNKQIKDIKFHKGYLLNNSKFYLLFVPFGVLLICSICYKIYKYKNVDSKSNFKKINLRDVRKLIKEAEIEISKDNYKKSLELLNSAFTKFLNVQVDIQSQLLSKNAVAEELKKAGLNSEIIDKILKIVEEFNFYKYSSINLSKEYVCKVLNEVKCIITDIEF